MYCVVFIPAGLIYFKHGEGKHRIYNPSVEGSYECELCDFESPKETSLKKHFVGEHVNIDDKGLKNAAAEAIENENRDIMFEDTNIAYNTLSDGTGLTIMSIDDDDGINDTDTDRHRHR